MTDPQNQMADTEPKVQKMTSGDFKIYNRMAEGMDYFHTHFRTTWKMLHEACSRNKRPAGMSIGQFIAAAEQFCHHLTMHHTIEEQHVFPLLATKMEAFREELELLSQHKQIHEGLEKFEDYLGKCRSGEKDLRLDEMKTLMDGFGDVLWQHLDDEVEQLRAENMQKYWTIQEMKRMPL